MKANFIQDYNTKIDELNDEFGGIFDEEVDEGCEYIQNWEEADLAIVNQETLLQEMWNELVTEHGKEYDLPRFVMD